ncbi:hypothetical protein POTOM_044654 [Populus tomentosa]|uniref:3-oxo-5-alpha-steroid 4-dehydrogenase C-terminal domain-containing protein n=1 Tax=Populus tomentosa TaxID=118781 RepID=A0A8X7YKB7_POPTO|nr:hypothetical protein POTOM_044654 [Populus tomentosa]
MSPYLLHYFHRTFIYPLRIYQSTSHQNTKTTIGFPLILTFNGFLTQALNTYIQARWVSHYKSDYDSDGGLFWWKFFGGLVVFLWGMRINMWADTALLVLKRESRGYKVPRGGWFELVTCPNYFGEIVEWLGWAVMTWSWAGFGFFLYTCSNLVPRACANHKWATPLAQENFFNDNNMHSSEVYGFGMPSPKIIPREVPSIDKRRGRKVDEEKPSIAVIQGPKPGKPTDLSRMRQLFVKLEQNPPPHMMLEA